MSMTNEGIALDVEGILVVAVVRLDPAATGGVVEGAVLGAAALIMLEASRHGTHAEEEDREALLLDDGEQEESGEEEER